MKPSRSSRFFSWLFVALCLLAVALLAYPTVTTSAEQSGLEAAWERAREAGAYRFTTDVEQTLIPRPLPSMIGQTDERVDMRIEGDVTLPDQARMEFRFEGGGFNVPPLELVRDGAETYLLKGNERIPVENPAGLSSPTSDYLGYLAAAENVQPCPASPPALEGTEGGLTCYAYDINGPRFAEYVRDQMEEQLGGELPPQVTLSPSPLFQRMSGHGELWVDADGLPLRQVVDLEIPGVSEEYDARAHIIVDFHFDEAAIERINESTIGRIGQGININVAPTDLYCLLFSIAVASVLVVYRRRWVYGLIAVSVSIIMVVTPLLQVAGIVRFQERQAQAAPAETIADALGLPSETQESTQPATHNSQPATRTAAPSDYEPDLKCGDGDPGADADGDGLSDADENCLGTDPEHEDSDRDTITDTLEIDGFDYGGNHWTSDPFNPDSNRDGLTDLAEWPEPVGAAPDLDVADDWDPDGDGVPNLWDEDNDGDGVPDNLDLSPFARTSYSGTFSLSTQGNDFDGYQYIEIQVQPEITSHLRYSTGLLDWPYDELGQIMDLDDSTEDIQLFPMLKIHTNQAPDRDLAQGYGVTVFEEDNGYTLYMSLYPVGDGGTMVAFYAKVAYGPDELADIRWDKVELVWTAQLSQDQEVDGKIVTTVTPIGVQAEESFRVTGLQVTKSRNYESAILGTPETPGEDRYLFNLIFGLSNTFLTHQDPDIQEVGQRFSSSNTDIKQTWGVPAEYVVVDLPANPYGHSDEGMGDLPVRIRNFLNDNYSTDNTPSLVIAIQEEVGLYGLDDQGQFEPGSHFNLNLSNVAMTNRRSLKSNTYQYEDDSWQSLDLEETLDMVEQRHKDELSDILEDLEEDYPDLTEEDLELLLKMFYTAWFVGQTRIMSLDGQPMAPDGRDDEEVYDQINQDQDTLPAYLLEATHLGEHGGGLRIGDSQTQDWVYQREQEGEGNEVGFLGSGWATAGMAGVHVVRTILNLRTAFQAAGFAGEMGFFTRMKIFSDNASQGSRKLGAAGAVVAILAIWTVFFVTAGLTGWDWDSPVVRQAGVYAAVATIITLIMFAISLNPIGAILMGIWALLDLICFAVSLGQFSLTTALINAITDLIYSVDVLTTFEDVDFVDFDTKVMDENIGIVVGNRFRVTDECVGTIKRTSEGDNDDLEDSYVSCTYRGSAADATVVDKNGGRDCSRSGTILTCSDPVGVEYELDTAKRNVKLTVKASVRAKTLYQECVFGKCSPKSQYTDLPDDLPEYDQWDPMTFYLDVLPDDLFDLWDWGEIINPDPDGDGLSNDEEDSLGTNPNEWDTDGDGLSDGFEFDSQEDLGTDPLKADTDGDGLPDGLEYRIGTKINAQDSDDDGLTDGEEFFHEEGGNWRGGSMVNLPSGRTAWVFSDPLVADADGDGLNDESERNSAVSPYGYNDAPRLTLEAGPLAESLGGAVAVYTKVGDTVAMTLTLESTGPHPVNSTLTLCLPDFLINVQGGDMQGDSTPPTVGADPSVCPNGLAWSFATPNDLAVNGVVSTTVTADVTDPGASASGEISTTLPYRIGDDEEDVTDQVTVVVDREDPDVTITAPVSGTLLGGGISNYVIGGSASDETSWVTEVEVNLPNVGWVGAEGISPWAYTWELPDDGEYTLRARSYDYLGHNSLEATVAVTVDNTAPTVTLDLADGEVVTGESGSVITVTLEGDAGDNLSGLTRVQISIDDRPWREVWAEGGAPLTANWSTEWLLPNEESAQGEHTIEVRALDRAGNESAVLLRTIIVDVVPPTSELTDRTYLSDPPPHVLTDQQLDLYGVANDAGNVPEPSRPVELAGELDSIDDATIWLELSSVGDDDDGVSVVWLGDFNGDRLGDFAVGLPGAEDGAGRVTIVYGRAGGWPTPHDAELLANSPTSLVGKAGAGIGDTIGAAGDVDGDGFSDMLIGDAANNRVYVVFGRPGSLGRDLELNRPRYPYWSELTAPSGEQIGEWLGAAGDVDGDGLDDLLIGATGAEGNAYLLLGEAAPWWETVPLDVKAAAEIATDPTGAFLSGVGDMDGDQYDDFVVAEGNTVYLFEGQDVFESSLELGDVIATFASSETRPQVAALGDVNGDDLSDFIYADGSTPQLIFGDVNRDWDTQTLNFSPAASGFLVAPGDVDADGLNDILLGNADGDAYLVLGENLSEVAATLTDVQAAASTLYAAGADLNSDRSSDLLLVPGELGGTMMSAVDYGPMPHVNPDDLPVVTVSKSAHQRVGVSPLALQAILYVNDDGTCTGGIPCYANIQAAVDAAAAAGDTITVEPGVYGSFTVDGVNDLTISGIHPDAVFVDGDSGAFAVRIQNCTGVKLEDLTLRNAADAVYLENAGVGGHEDEAQKIVLDTVLIYDFTDHAVAMDRDGAARLTRCTLAGGDNHFEIYGPTDPAADAEWSTILTDSRAATDARGDIFAVGEEIYFVDDSAQIDTYNPAGTWSSLPAPPEGFNAGMTVDENNHLWALRGDELGGFDGPVHAIAYVSDDEIYAGGDFHHIGDFAVDYIAKWDGSEWKTVGAGGYAPDDIVYAIEVDGDHLYAGGRLGLRYLPERYHASAWQDFGAITSGGAVYAIAVDDDGDVYAGGNFNKIGGLSANKIAKREFITGDWKWVGHNARSDCNGLHRGSHVSAMVIKDGWIYLGGQFHSVASCTGPGFYDGLGCCTNVARLDMSDDEFGPITDCDNMLYADEHVYALGFSGNDLVVGGDFSCVDMEHGPGWSHCYRSADNLAILKPNGSWSLPDYLETNGAVRTLEIDGSSLYIGGDFTKVGGSTTAQRLAHYDNFPNTGGDWHAIGDTNDRVRAIVRGGGNTYVGGYFTQVGGNAAFGLARWDGSQWTRQTFYEYDGSWQLRSGASVRLGAGSAIASDGDGILYAIPGGGSSAFYRYTISSDTWAERASLPDGVGAGSALVWADDYLYGLRGGGTSDFYRYNPAGNEWHILDPVTDTIPIDAGGALAWDGRNWLYVLAGGNGRQFLRYRIPDEKWEVLGDGSTITTDDDTPGAVNAGGDLARIGQNLYGVPGGGEELWSYDPMAVYPEKLTLDHVAIVAPENASAATWVNLDDVLIPPDDFVVGGADNTWVGGESVTWSPEPLLDGSAEITHDEARFLDAGRYVYRLDSGALLDSGYHTYRPKAVVGGGEEFTNIQAAIDSGANRVELRTGTFQETFYLISGVEVIGNGADLTILEPPAGNTDPALVRAEGVVGARLSMLTLHGADSGVDGLSAEDGTQSIVVDHTIIRDANTGISTTGGATELEVVNNTIVSNTNGLVAADCAPVDVRNTIFADHSDTGLTYDGCATRKLHKYNLYWDNGADLSPNNPGPGEMFLDPLFVDPGPPSHDYHTEDASPVIDAGDPGDPPPPGGGGRVDIGYIEQNRAALHVDDDYCETCLNDGLSWQVDAFDNIQDGLDKAADNVRDLKGVRYTVGVGAGTYTETITIPSYVRLIGSGAEETTIDANSSGVPVTFDSVVQAEINGFTIKGCPDTAAITVTGASNGITITHNIIDGCSIGVGFSGRASGLISFNTLVHNGIGVLSSGPGSWAGLENNILYNLNWCEGDLWVEDSGQIFNDYNLRHWGEYDWCYNVDEGPNEISGNPDFAPGGYRLEPDSPARDAASPFAEVPPGGGERADMGYYELTAEPVTLFLGREDVSSATGNSGMDEVEVGFSQINDPADPVTDTVPSTWTTVTLDTPGETVSYWQTAFTPTQESLYRFYSRGTDVAGNQECSGESTCSPWYDGAFVADSVSPVVTWTQPTNGSFLNSPLELRAQVYDYAAGAFSVEDIYFVVDGAEYQAEWAADPWDEESKEPRTFRAWLELDEKSYTDAEAVAKDRAGNVMSDTISFTVAGSSGADSTPPVLVVISPAEGAWFTGTVVFSGAVTDGGSGVAAVEVSLDGGYTWLPATVDGTDWHLTWEAPAGQEFVSYPARVRARDRAGNSTTQARTFSIDNVPPVGPHVEEFVAIIGPFEKESPPGTHFDMPVQLRTTWRKPFDGSGVATTLIAVDQVSDTLPTLNVGTATSYTHPLSLPGDWYVHLAAQDGLGNQFTRHYGPWHVGTVADWTTLFQQRRQTIVVDGQIDVDWAMEEWHRIGWEWGIFEFMDDFEPPMHIGDLTPQAALDWWGRQRLFATWDGANVYLGWMGAWWTLDGTLWAYLGTQAGGCTAPVVPMSDTLPFAAEYAIEITSPTSGTLWACTSGVWQEDTVTDWEFAQGGGGDTEIRLALNTFSIIDLQLIAFALDDEGEPWSVFPTTNPLFGDWGDEYLWHPGTTITPTLGQPVGTSVLMALDSLQAPQAAWCANSDLQYVTELRNQELYTVPAGLQLVFDVSPGLDYQSVEGAILSGDWQFDVPELPPGVEHPITITGKLASDVCNLVGSTSVSISVSLPIISSLAQLDLSHRLDCEPPTVTVATDPAKAIRPVYGSATDGDGSGVALVEYQVNDGDWHTVTGTLFWAADIELPTATTWQLHVRAWDQCGQTSEVTTVEFSDSIPPTTTLDTRYLERPDDLEGTASDLPSGGEVVAVEVRIDDETAAWQPASVGAPGAGGVQNWQFTWDSAWDGVTHTLWIRAADVAGNVGQAGPFEVYVTEGEPVEPVGGHTEPVSLLALSWLWIALVVAVAGTAVVATLKKRTARH